MKLVQTQLQKICSGILEETSLVNIFQKFSFFLRIQYTDLLTKKVWEDEFLYFIPERKHLKTRETRGIINASKKELETVLSFFVN